MTFYTYIELLRAENLGSSNGYAAYISASWGGGYFVAHAFELAGDSVEYKIGSRLEISSSIYTKYYKKSDEAFWATPDASFKKSYKLDEDYFEAAETTYTKTGGKGKKATATIKIKKIYDANGGRKVGKARHRGDR